MSSYYAYLKDRVAAAGVSHRAHLDQLVETERNVLWQMMMANPAYDERTRLAALAAFDDAAARISVELERRAAPSTATPQRGPATHGQVHRAQPDRVLPARPRRSWARDLALLLVGILIGAAGAYFAGAYFQDTRFGIGGTSDSRGTKLVASTNSFKFASSSPREQSGEITVEYARGASRATGCDVEATYRQLLEYVRFDADCRTVSFKFVPLADLLANYNYLQGYIVFTATINTAGSAWKGTASVYFSVDASA